MIPALLHMVTGRSKRMFQAWPTERDETWRAAVEVVAMDGFTGCRIAIDEELTDVAVVMDRPTARR